MKDFENMSKEEIYFETRRDFERITRKYFYMEYLYNQLPMQTIRFAVMNHVAGDIIRHSVIMQELDYNVKDIDIMKLPDTDEIEAHLDELIALVLPQFKDDEIDHIDEDGIRLNGNS